MPLVILGLLVAVVVVSFVLLSIFRGVRAFRAAMSDKPGLTSESTAVRLDSIAPTNPKKRSGPAPSDNVRRSNDDQLARTRADIASREARERQRLAAHQQETMRRSAAQMRASTEQAANLTRKYGR